MLKLERVDGFKKKLLWLLLAAWTVTAFSAARAGRMPRKKKGARRQPTLQKATPRPQRSRKRK